MSSATGDANAATSALIVDAPCDNDLMLDHTSEFSPFSRHSIRVTFGTWRTGVGSGLSQRWVHHSCAIVLITAMGAAISLMAAVYEAPDDRPTADEVAILVHMNRFRADPAAEARRILDANDLPDFFWRGVDRAMFEREMAALPASGPVVFDLDALRAARRHSYYMIHNGLGHDEAPDKEGFSGTRFVERMKAAGFTAFAGGKNCFAAAGNAWQSHVGFLIDFGPGGAGGMQAGRGHRANMANSQAKVVGASAVPYNGKISVTHNFGHSNQRFAGGVVYTDRNRNGEFDPGEGRGGIEIRCGTKSARTWPSGGFVHPIDGGKGAVGAIFGSARSSLTYESGDTQVWFTWAIPIAEDAAMCDRLMADVSDLSVEQRASGRGLKAVVALVVGSESLLLEEGQRAAVRNLCGEVAEQLERDRSAVLGALDAGDAGMLKTALAEAKTWRGTQIQTWFVEAEQVGKALAVVVALETARNKGQAVDPKRVTQLCDALRLARNEAPEDLGLRFASLLERVSK